MAAADDSRLDATDRRMATLSARINDVLIQVEERFDLFFKGQLTEAQIDELLKAIYELGARFQGFKERIEALEERVSVLEERASVIAAQ